MNEGIKDVLWSIKTTFCSPYSEESIGVAVTHSQGLCIAVISEDVGRRQVGTGVSEGAEVTKFSQMKTENREKTEERKWHCLEAVTKLRGKVSVRLHLLRKEKKREGGRKRGTF